VRLNSALGVAGVQLKVQFDPVSRRIFEKHLPLTEQRHVVNVKRNSPGLQTRGSGGKICAREGNMVESRDHLASTLLVRQSLG
jgi:hypothetical protein